MKQETTFLYMKITSHIQINQFLQKILSVCQDNLRNRSTKAIYRQEAKNSLNAEMVFQT